MRSGSTGGATISGAASGTGNSCASGISFAGGLIGSGAEIVAETLPRGSGGGAGGAPTFVGSRVSNGFATGICWLTLTAADIFVRTALMLALADGIASATDIDIDLRTAGCRDVGRDGNVLTTLGSPGRRGVIHGIGAVLVSLTGATTTPSSAGASTCAMRGICMTRLRGFVR